MMKRKYGLMWNDALRQAQDCVESCQLFESWQLWAIEFYWLDDEGQFVKNHFY